MPSLPSIVFKDGKYLIVKRNVSRSLCFCFILDLVSNARLKGNFVSKALSILLSTPFLSSPSFMIKAALVSPPLSSDDFEDAGGWLVKIGSLIWPGESVLTVVGAFDCGFGCSLDKCARRKVLNVNRFSQTGHWCWQSSSIKKKH